MAKKNVPKISRIASISFFLLNWISVLIVAYKYFQLQQVPLFFNQHDADVSGAPAVSPLSREAWLSL